MIKWVGMVKGDVVGIEVGVRGGLMKEVWGVRIDRVDEWVVSG